MTKRPLPPGGVGSANTQPGSVNAVIVAYYLSADFGSLVHGAQITRRSILESFREQHGGRPFAQMPQRFIVATLATMKQHEARVWFRTMRGLMQFAVINGFRTDDPTTGVKIPHSKREGISVTSDIGTPRQEGLAAANWLTRRYVYVIGTVNDAGPVKIGISSEPQTRLSELQVGNPHILKILAQCPGGKEAKAALHSLFQKERLQGEWFKRSARVCMFVDMILCGVAFSTAIERCARGVAP